MDQRTFIKEMREKITNTLFAIISLAVRNGPNLKVTTVVVRGMWHVVKNGQNTCQGLF